MNTAGFETSRGGDERRGDEPPGAPRTAIAPGAWFCLFRGDAGPMGVAVECVAEVLEAERVVRLPWSPPQVVGLCLYHREVVPIVVFGSLLGEARENRLEGSRRSTAANPDGEGAGGRERTGCVVLILKTEHGAWGLRVDAETTVMSRESPEYHAPRISASGAVLIGTVERDGGFHGILDAEATWRGLRSAVARRHGRIIEPDDSSAPPADPGAPAGCRES